MIFGDLMGRWGRASPDKEALVDAITGRRFTYGDLAADVYKLANFLQDELDVVQGDRVCCLAFNRTEYLTLFFALGRLGAVLVPLNFRLAVDEFVYYLEDARPAAFFFDRDHQATVAGIEGKVELPRLVCLDDDSSVGRSLPAVWDGLSAEPPPAVDIGPDDPQLFIYTSGTTGLPKGVVQTFGMLAWNGFNTILGWDMHSADKTILHPAMFYTAGWNVFTLPLFMCRGTNILVERFEADLIL
ncbi:MAG: AMP-binding protein, partial [Proteobacteria bacterium]|nr:AMP-binding protein [Pseudomonadota bacterium]